MDVERQRLANAIFLDACQLPTEQVASFLQQRCGDDAAVQQRVLAMLAADAEQDAFLEGPSLAAHEVPETIVGERGYRLLRQIAEGGMGRVYLAERVDGSYAQQVAIKLMHRDLNAAPEQVRRFRAERQILAGLVHRNIARLLDGGTLADGSPFLVMEYVDGVRLDHWCEQRAPSVHERILLFLQICETVQFAHQALVVHRDLKPSNILVTATGEPRLLDFGIAKVLDGANFGQAPALTRTGDHAMTLAYASPEQVRGERIGTSSDVYALGVIFYEMLTGVLPYRTTTADPVSLARAVCEEQPEAPSRSSRRTASEGAVNGTARSGDADAPLQRRLHGDLDATVLKALRKESAARYTSVEQFAADIRRHLDGLPVLARRGTFSYRMHKFVTRHRWPIAAASVLFSVLLAAVVMLRWQLARTEVERDKATRVADFIVQMFESSDPQHVQVRDSAHAAHVTVREVMDANAPRIATDLVDNPAIQASLLAVVARIYDGLALPDLAQRYGAMALARLAAAGEVPSRASVQVHLFLIQSLEAVAQHDAALAEAGLALHEMDLLKTGDDFDRARALRGRGQLRRNLGQWDLAEVDILAARQMFIRVRGPDDTFVAGTSMDLASIADGRGDFRGCESRAQEALAAFSRLHADAHLVSVAARATLASCELGLGNLEVAEAALRENLQAQRSALGEDNAAVGSTLNNLGNVLNQQRRYADAEPLLRDALRLARAQRGENHPALTPILLNLSTSVFEQGRHDEGIDLQQKALALAPREPQQQYAIALNNLGYKLYQVGRLGEAETRWREATRIFAEVAPNHVDRAMILSSLGRLLTETGRAAEAQPLIETGLALRLAALPADHWAIADSRSLLGSCLAALGHHVEAEPLLRQGLADLRATMGAEHVRTKRAQARLDAFTAERASAATH
ncbi:MAG: serine/threonine-protein kinase [Tahibacter sp.]